MPRVDVVIPAYNPGPYLKDTIESVIAQTFTDWRCVVVDDGSTEDLSWVDGVDRRVERIRQPNAGLSAARNRGIAHGDAPLVAFLDADDLWLREKLEAQVAALSETPGTFSATGFDYIDAEGSYIGDGLHGFTGTYAEQLMLCAVAICTVMAHRDDLDAVGGFTEHLRQVQDWDLYLKLTARGVRVLHLPEVLARYRKHDANMSYDYVTLMRESLSILAPHRSAAAAAGQHDLAAVAEVGERRVRRLAGVKAFDAFRATYASRPKQALGHLAFAGRHAPSYTARNVFGRALPASLRR